MMIDFVARRQAAIAAQRALRAEWEVEEELEDKLSLAYREFAERIKHDRAQRQKYEQAMREKRAAAAAGGRADLA
jgi:hypothetical protein